MRFVILFVGHVILAASVTATPVSPSRPILPISRDYSDTLKILLEAPESDVDLAWSKLVIDNLIDPEANIDSVTNEINQIATQAILIAGSGATDQDKLSALRQVIYKPGEWNGNEPFSYDFDNPNGRLAKNKTISEYLGTRRGNCVSMPILFLVVGEKLGLELNLTTAPRHAFVQFMDRESGKVIHLEPTSGALPQRISWQRKVLPMTDRSIESGMYMQRLSKRKQIAAMAESLLQSLREKGDFEEMLEVTALILDVFPENDIALLNAADASRRLIQIKILPHYHDPNLMPLEVRNQFDSWAFTHDSSLDRLQFLGWEPVVDTAEVFIPE